MNELKVDLLLQFLYSEITERRDYSASKSFEVVVEKVKEIFNVRY